MLLLLVTFLMAVSAVPMPQHSRPNRLKPQVQNILKKLEEIKEPAPTPHQSFEHTPLKKPSEEDKHVPVEQRMQKLLEAVKFLQGQQMVLGSALHSIHTKIKEENEQIEDQQGVLAKSMEALIENVATRQDLVEVENAANEDNDLHIELEDTSKKLKSMVKHMSEHQGHPEEDFQEKWSHLKQRIKDSSLDLELDHAQEVIRALSGHTETSSSKLFYFVLVNVTLAFGILLWYKAKPTYSYSR